MISRAWSNVPITFEITQNEAHMMKIYIIDEYVSLLSYKQLYYNHNIVEH
jgi:hypothetical protein